MTATSEEKEHGISHVGFEDEYFYKACEGDEKVSLTFEFEETQIIHHIVLRENLSYSQRIEGFEIFAQSSNGLKLIYQGTVVGSRKICKLEQIETSKLIIHITASRKSPTLRFVGIYGK